MGTNLTSHAELNAPETYNSTLFTPTMLHQKISPSSDQYLGPQISAVVKILCVFYKKSESDVNIANFLNPGQKNKRKTYLHVFVYQNHENEAVDRLAVHNDALTSQGFR